MRAILKNRLLVLVPETESETASLDSWKTAHAGHVLFVKESAGTDLAASSLGPRAEACREPINVRFSASPEIAAISNFAATPFVLDGLSYGSVEGFWQSLKLTDTVERTRVGALSGLEAKRAGKTGDVREAFEYAGRRIVIGTADHWDLMERACLAKFEQNAEARAALLATGDRPLVHRVRRDSRTIPGAIMAGIWMRIRTRLACGESTRAGGTGA